MAETNSNKTFTSNRHGKSVRLTFFSSKLTERETENVKYIKKKSGSVVTACWCPLPQWHLFFFPFFGGDSLIFVFFFPPTLKTAYKTLKMKH